MQRMGWLMLGRSVRLPLLFATTLTPPLPPLSLCCLPPLRLTVSDMTSNFVSIESESIRNGVCFTRPCHSTLPFYPPFHSTHPTLPREPTFGASFPDHAVIASPLSSSLAATKQDKATTGGQVGGDQREDRGGEGGEDEGPDMTNILNIIGALFGGEGRPIHAMPSWRLSIICSDLYPSCSPALLSGSPPPLLPLIPLPHPTP